MKNENAVEEPLKSKQVVVIIYRDGKVGNGARTIYFRPHRETLEQAVRELYPNATSFKYANRIFQLQKDEKNNNK